MSDLTPYFDDRMVQDPDLARAERSNAPFCAPMGFVLWLVGTFVS